MEEVKFNRFEEMDKLMALLSKQGIPFVVRPRLDFELGNIHDEILTYSIITYDERGHIIIDAICHPHSYGWKSERNDKMEALIEVMAHDEYSWITFNDVVGYLKAEEAFKYFYTAWGRCNDYLIKGLSDEN